MLHKSLGWDLATREPVEPQPGSGVQRTVLLGSADKCVACRVVNDMFTQSYNNDNDNSTITIITIK